MNVIITHCASHGVDEYMDNGNKSVKSFELFSRLMNNPAYEKLVLGETSEITPRPHCWAIKPLLESPDWHARHVNGTDYPLPAISPLISTNGLASMGLLQEECLIQTYSNCNITRKNDSKNK